MKNDENVSLRCKLQPEVSTIIYEVYLFNKFNKFYQAIEVVDYSNEDGFTKNLSLPNDVNFVSVCVIKANECSTKNSSLIKNVSFFKVLIYLILASIFFAVLLCGLAYHLTPLESNETVITIGSLLEGHRIVYDGVFRSNNIGSTIVRIDAKKLMIVDAAGNDVTKFYDIKCQYGTYEIKSE